MALAMFEPVLKEHFPFWDELSPTDKEYLCENTLALSFPKGTNLHDGSSCSGVILVRKGCLRLYIMSEDGKDITLYRIHSGELCMLSASCVLQSITFDVFVDCEENCECYIINGPAFASLAEKYANIKIFTLETATSRFSDVVWLMQQILFMSMDKRLAIFLLDEINRTGQDTVALTHEQIAKYMGSAREVVSRMLKYFSNEKIVELSRKGVRVINRKRLRELSF